MIRSIKARQDLLGGPVRLASISANTPFELVSDTVPGEQRQLLEAMGLAGAPGSLRVCRSGSPCIVEVDGTRLGLSSAIARCIMAVPLPSSR
ncbi:MAG TPA: ferrous iron transport protein A [Planctomycetes bacterium]|nr:ferrous iron transport protein A [Planctomycetota bacterium]HIN81164.1 ferrous iron transport protein A [Planctomycetota bacterium]